MIMTNETTDASNCSYPMHLFKRISWTAIFVGALVAIGLGFLLNLFGIAIGLTAFTLEKDGALVLAAGGLIGILIGAIVSMLAAGYTAGYLGRFHCPQRNFGILYGFTTWSLAIVLSAGIGAQISSYVTSYSNTISHSVLVTTQEKSHPSEASTPSVNTNQKVNKMSEETVLANNLAYAASSVFTIFFVGALASCFGACWGMSCKRDD